MAIYSNNFRDREKEIFPEAAHLEFVKHVERTKEYPYLWNWHVPLVMGRADAIDYDRTSGMAIAAGYFFPGQEHAAKALSDMGEELGVSHGYEYPEDSLVNGVYGKYRTFEISPLPRTKAANDGTMFASIEDLEGESKMPLRTEVREHLVKTNGEAAVKALESLMTANSKAMKAAGIDFKDFDAEDGHVHDDTQAASAAAATGSRSVPVGATTAAEAVNIADLVIAAVKEANAPIMDRLDALERADEDKIAAKYLRPRVGDPAHGVRPGTDDSTLVTGPRGGIKSKDLASEIRAAMTDIGIDEAAREAEKQMGMKGGNGEREAADWIPDELKHYASLGLMGSKALA
jgi:hypothetical protein